MNIIKTDKGEVVKIFAKTIEEKAIEQIVKMANSHIGKNAHIRIMPDAHVGAGCVIGTTMRITNSVVVGIVGVDIGCGVDLVKTDIDFAKRLDELDEIIREYVPYGRNVHNQIKTYRPFAELRCWKKLGKNTTNLAIHSLGTLGGGNHFIEAYEEGYLSVHSGSRNIGWRVANYYTKLSEKRQKQKVANEITEFIKNIPPEKREKARREYQIKNVCPNGLEFLEGQDMDDYLHDMAILQEFAVNNRKAILETIVDKMCGVIKDQITSTHNYIDVENRILRKGAISAQKDELLVIPLNMRDGLLVCKGKGNEDWNYSAPHGAGRLYGRSVAKKTFTVEEYKKSMEGIYSTCINESTLDEAPFVYKDWKEITECIEPTVEIISRLKPIFNFKASN